MANRPDRPSAHDESKTREIAHFAAEKAHEGASIAAEKAHEGAHFAAEKTQVAAHIARDKAMETAYLTAEGIRDDQDSLSIRRDDSNLIVRAFRSIFGVYDINRRSSLYTLRVGGKQAGYTSRFTLNGTSMLRPQKIRGILLLPLAICVLAAIVIGAIMFNTVNDNVLSSDQKAAREVAAALASPAEVQLPGAATVVGLDDATIAATLLSSDSQIYQASATSGDVSLLLYRIPPAVSVAVAQTEIEKGISHLDAGDAATLLNGFWEFSASRDPDSTTMAFRYADFAHNGVGEAITACMIQQGLPEDSVTDTGTDEVGNTYKTGTAVVNGISTTWRVSSIALTDMYSVKGLPSTASYVVLKYTY